MTRARCPVATGPSTDYSVLGYNLLDTVTCTSSIGLDWIIKEVTDTHRGLCRNQVVPSIQNVPGKDFRRLPMLN